MKKIIIVSGKAQNGKDSTADILMQQLKGTSIKLSYADYLKLIAKKFFGWDGKKDEKGRSILQFVGTDLIREELGMENFHVNRVCEDIKIAEKEYDYFFIPDARRKNEIYFTQAMFPDAVTTIRVSRKDFKSPLTYEQQNHISEIGLDDFKFDHYVKSESGLYSLWNEVAQLVEIIEGGI
ncbi:MAG TPA: hypothetical protein VIM42_02595 [Clostridium sp.]